ncbi:MAG: PHP domain-containing protein [Halanaerobiales bacterium]|nr:PHP domain-containing protein [Halanaerobiales bacterium]
MNNLFICTPISYSDMSLQDGICTVEQIAKKASELGMPAVALTDHGRCGNLLKFKKACEKYKIKSILGSEFYVAPESMLLKEKIENAKPTYHLTLLAKNEEGLKNLFRLSSIGWLEGFYYRMRIDLETLRKHSEGLLALSGCMSGTIAQCFLDFDFGGKDPVEKAKSFVYEFQDIFGEDFYIEIQNHGLNFQKPLAEFLFAIAKETDTIPVATNDVHYVNKEDFKLRENIVKLTTAMESDTNESYFKSYEEMVEKFKEYPRGLETLENTIQVAKKCNVEWNYGKTIWPVYDLPKGRSAIEELKEQSWKGFQKLFGEGTKEYKDRLEYELEVIIKMGFPTYFLVVADLIKEAKRNDILSSPGRGSSAGSLTCYCLGITQIDPIEYKLYFSRFLGPGRAQKPIINFDELTKEQFDNLKK